LGAVLLAIDDWRPTFVPQGILLDIEGTTSSIEFVYNVMFPFARQGMRACMESVATSPDLQSSMRQVSFDAGHGEDFQAWLGPMEDRSFVDHATSHLLALMDSDSKSTGLKSLQGHIWKSGFESGELKSHLYDDVYPALLRWSRREIDIRIYSSGSVVAQKLFFGHTPLGDLRSFFKGFYDTTVGGKREAVSYQKISNEFAVDPESIVFFSDNALEILAASEAGMTAIAVVRPGNAPLPKDFDAPQVKSFANLW
jgi:enolase-phosphatase E1